LTGGLKIAGKKLDRKLFLSLLTPGAAFVPGVFHRQNTTTAPEEAM
jgi:hypothetical protein